MAQIVEKIYKLDIQGTDSVNDLKNAIDQLNDKLKTLNETSIEYKNTLAQLTEYQSKLADAMKGISDSSQTTNESLNGIKETVDGVAESISALGEDVMDAFAEGLAQGMAEAAQETIQLGETMDKGVTTVKDLKQEISDLRDRLVTLDKGSDDYKATVQELVDAQVKLKEVMNAGKNETQAAEGSYNALSQRMSALKQVWKETTDEATRNEIGQQINQINTELKALDASIGNSQRNVGNYKSALEGLDESFVGWKEELKQCKEALQQLDPSTQAYADTMARAAELTHNISEQQEMLKNASTDVGDVLTNVQGVGTNLAAGFSALNAAMGLFGEENEEVQQAMLKVQQAMALVQGMQGMDGFWKNTKKLSTQMGLATKETNKNTAATKANANASKQDALSKKAEGAATESVIPAQKGLNAAMKANPIGFIIGLIASLIAIFSLLKDKIMEMIGSNKEMSAAFDKVKAVLAGFGNIIKKSVINPIKMAIIPIKTLAKVMIDLFKGDWSKIGDDIKDGFNEMKDTAIDSINVVKQFKEGYDKETAEQNEAARKKEAEARAKDRDNYIKDMEAKHKADWKYTEAGKKAYEEYYNSLLEMYDKDSEEYRQALRDKEAYLNDFNEKAKKDAEDLASMELKLDVARYGEGVKYSQKWYDYEKKLYDDAMKLKHSYAYAYAVGKVPKDVEQQIMEAELRWETYLKSRNEYYKKQNDKFTKDTEKFVNDFKSKFDSLVNESDRALRSTYQTVSALTATMKIGGKDYEAIDMYMKEWEKLFRTIYGLDENTIQLKLKKVREDITSGAVKKSWDEYVKSISKTLTNEFYNMDKTVQAFVGKLQQEFNEDKITVGIDFPKDEIDNIEQIYGAQMDNLYEKTLKVRKDIDVIFPLLAKQFAESLGKDVSAVTEAEIGQLVPEFQKLLDEEQTFVNNYLRLNTEMFQKESDVWVKEWNNKIDIVKAGNQAINDIAEQNFKEQINNAIRWQGVYGNALRDLYEDKDYYTETYNEQKGQLERLREMYLEMAQDEKLTFEEKENAKREAAKLTGELIQLEYDKEVNMLKVQKGLWKEWVNAVKDAASGVGDILGSLSDYYTGLMELEQAKIDKQLEDKEITQEQAEALYAQQRSNFEKSKNLQLAMTWINGFSAAIGAYQSMASIPYVGPVLGAVAAAAALATTAVQAAKIKQTTMDNPYGGGGGGSSSSVNYQLPDVMEYENSLGRNLTGMDDTDNINNDGSGRGNGGRGETRVYVVESDIQNALDKSNKRKTEVTF